MVFGGLIKAAPLISAGSSLLGGLTSAFGARGLSQRDLMALQLQTSLDQMRLGLELGPSWEMAGLKAAGINPMLRYGKGGSTVGTHGSISIPPPFNPMEHLGAGIAGAGTSAFQALQSASQSRLNMTSSERQRAESTRARVDAVRVGAEVGRIRENTELTRAQQNTEIARAWETTERAILARAQQILPAHQARLLAAQMDAAQEQAILNSWLAATARAETALRNLEYGPRSEEATAREAAARVTRTQSEIDLQVFDDAVIGFATRIFQTLTGGGAR